MKRLLKKLLVLSLLLSVGVGMIMLFCWRAEQIDKSMGVNYEEVNR